MTATEKEAKLEENILEQFESLGWNAFYTSGGQEGGKKLDQKYNREIEQPIYYELLEEKILELNPDIDAGDIDEVTSEIKSRIRTQDPLVEANKEFHYMLMRGVDVDFGSETKHIDIIDDDVTGNRFDVVSQFVYREQKVTKKPDVVMLINGVPVVVGELKYGVSNDCDDAITDMQTYEDEVESLFRIPLFNIAITSRKLKYGSINAPLHQYNQWRPEDIVSEYQYDELGYYDKDKSLKSLCDPEKILDILNNFVMFQRDGGGLAKIIPRHQQYFAVKAIFDRFRKSKEKGMSARGLIWHTQGSGKSYTMFYAAVQAVRQCNSQAYILVDRNNLEEQMRKDLSDIGHPVTADVADSKEELMPRDYFGQTTTVTLEHHKII